jgi:hypothetical protein
MMKQPAFYDTFVALKKKIILSSIKNHSITSVKLAFVLSYILMNWKYFKNVFDSMICQMIYKLMNLWRRYSRRSFYRNNYHICWISYVINEKLTKINTSLSLSSTLKKMDFALWNVSFKLNYCWFENQFLRLSLIIHWIEFT